MATSAHSLPDQVRAWWACVNARNWAGARALLADDATLYWPASGEWLLDADAIVRVNAIYPEGWTLQLLELATLTDGRVLSVVRVAQAGQVFLAHTLWRAAPDGRLAGGTETWATAESPPDWRSAAAIGAYRRDTPGTPGPDQTPGIDLT